MTTAFALLLSFVSFSVRAEQPNRWQIAARMQLTTAATQVVYVSNTAILFLRGRTLEEWNTATQRRTRSLEIPEKMDRITLTNDRAQLAYVADGRIRFMDRVTGRPVEREGFNGAHYSRGTGVAISMDGQRIAAPHRKGGVGLWNATNGQFISRLPTPHDLGATPMRIALSSDNQTLIATFGSTVATWNFHLQTTHLIETEGSSVSELVVSPDGRYFTLVKDRACGLTYETLSQDKVNQYNFGDLIGVAYSPRRPQIAVLTSGSNLFYLAPFNAANRHVLTSYYLDHWTSYLNGGGLEAGVCLDYSPDGTRLAIVQGNGLVIILDAGAFPADRQDYPPEEDPYSNWWQELAETSGVGRTALARLLRQGDEAIPLLRDQLLREALEFPPTALSSDQLEGMISLLGSNVFEARDRASRVLRNAMLTEIMAPPPRYVSTAVINSHSDPILETRRRAQHISETMCEMIPTITLRTGRAIQFLEERVHRDRSAEALTLLRRLATNGNSPQRHFSSQALTRVAP